MGTPQAPESTVGEPLLALTDRYAGPSSEQVLARLQQPDMQGIKGVLSWRGAFLSGDACPVESPERTVTGARCAVSTLPRGFPATARVDAL